MRDSAGRGDGLDPVVLLEALQSVPEAYAPAEQDRDHDDVQVVDEGATALTGDFPVNMSGGVLSSNPIGASGMIRFAEAAMQVRGTAGDHQVDGARTALGHAYGGGSQFFAMWIVRSEKPA